MIEILDTFYIFIILQNELFEKAKNEILDEVISLSQVTPQHWWVYCKLNSGFKIFVNSHTGLS